uniref:F5/8 type C domain-containing protein n=1 Tax=uncultured Bacillota bacterium TaxID=344338 RepID=A0A650EN95_9FIRM|nr:hypothetical protein Firmicute1046_3250 [uncultured Firmicutes bacterium]
MKRILAVSLTIVMAFSTMMFTVAAQEEAVSVTVNGKQVVFPDEQPYMQNGRVMVPVRFVSEELGAEVAWFEETKTVTVMDETSAAALTVDVAEVTANNQTLTLDVSPVSRNNRTYVPLRFVSEALGAQVDWEQGSNTVSITRSAPTTDEGNNKKIYALYHGFRRTREHDGDLATWNQYADSSKSATGRDHINFSADLIDEEGIHQLANVNGGPIVGMQSEIDPDYVEYKMLLAKIANIDGFMIDFGFPEYGNTVLTKAFMEQARKYDMEIGADWCDGWLVDYDWIKGYRPEIQTREDKLKYFETSVQFLLDEVYGTETGANLNGHPVIFLFGGGPNATEMKNIIQAEYTYPEGLQEPYYIRRTGLSGTYNNGTVTFSDAAQTTQDWRNAGVDVHQWIVPRVRPMDDVYPYFDNYASFEDVKNYAQAYKALWESNQKVNVNTAVVTPGFDNRGCAGWGSGKFHGFDREDGEVYRWQWDYYNQNKNLIDVMFIASWSDFTEGHEIEPTVKNGYRELETTLEYATMFREKETDEHAKEALKIPQKIFEAKKYTQKLGNIGFDTADMAGLLDTAALSVSKGAYAVANALIAQAEQLQKDCEDNMEVETVTVSVPAGNLKVLSYEEETGDDPAKGIEVANGKPVSTNDDLAEGRAKNAVDGVIADSSRWISSQGKDSYWLDIDLQNEFVLIGADLYTGKMDGTYGLRDVKLQSYQDDDWVDIPGASVTGNDETNTDLFWTFDESVTTSKVRIVCNDGAIGVRLREIKVYADPNLTDPASVKPREVLKGKNVVKNKSVKTNDAVSTGPISNLVDGVIADDSRWISSQNNNTYWAEIDLAGEYTVVAADVYTGKDDGSWALETAKLEYLKDGDWATVPGTETVGNSKTNTDLHWTFSNPITTTKLRFVSDDGSRGVRVRELMVYEAGNPEDAAAEDTSFLERRGKELAQGKPVTASGELKHGKAEKAVDGLDSDSSMWLTKTDADSYWLEVDLQGTRQVMGADIYSGMSNGTWAVENVQVQYWQDGTWQNVPGGKIEGNPKSNTELRWNFNRPVTAEKIRFVFRDGARGVKLREVKLYEERASVESSDVPVYNMGKGIYLTIDESVAAKLRENYFDAMLYMQYLGDTDQTFKVTADCNRPLPEKIGSTQGDFSVVADIRQEITYGWEQCRVQMFRDNLALEHKAEQNSDFVIKGTGNLRNIEMQFQVYKKK